MQKQDNGPALLSARQAAKQFFGVCERKFHMLRAEGLVGPPVVLGPRLLRWPRAELEQAIANLPRQRDTVPPPGQLRQRINKPKVGGG